MTTTLEPVEYLIPKGKPFHLQEGDAIEKGDYILDGNPAPHDILAIKGVEALASYLVNEIQEVYRLQGVLINDKHIEVIVRQMLQKVEITDAGRLRPTSRATTSTVIELEEVNERLVEDVVALLDDVAVLEMERLALRDQVFDRLKRRVVRLDDDAALVLVVAAEADRAIDLGDDGSSDDVPRRLGNTRQTAGDVLGLGAFHRDTRQSIAGRKCAPAQPKDGLDREQEAGVAALRQLANLALGVMDGDRRLEVPLPRGVKRPSMTSRLVMPVDSSSVSLRKCRRPDPSTTPCPRFR